MSSTPPPGRPRRPTGAAKKRSGAARKTTPPRKPSSAKKTTAGARQQTKLAATVGALHDLKDLASILRSPPGRDLGAEVLARHDADSMRTAPPPDKSHKQLSSAGYALGVGLFCFALWLFLDARQLFTSANASPLGTRRSVSMSILRPIARVEEVFGLDRIVDGGNRALGRTGAFTPGQGSQTTIPPSTTLPPTTTTPVTTPGGHTSTTIPPTTTTLPVEAPLVEPTRSHPLTILQIGDSIGEDLGYGLASTIGNDSRVRLVQGSVGDTGLTNIAYFNWPGTLYHQLHQFHPKVVVVMLGANDWQGMLISGAPYQAGTPKWIEQYTARVSEMMNEATSFGAKVLWIGLPIMQSSSFSHDMEVLNSIFKKEAQLHPGVTFAPTWKLFSTHSGHFSEYLQVDGSLVEVRDADGIHIAPPGGTNLLGSYVVEKMDSVWHVRI
jgi:uncharacterized protein